MHSFIITGGTGNQRAEKIQTLVDEAAVSPFDVTTINPETTSISIERVRSMVPRLSIRPVAGPGHAVIIREAQTMTPEAQNAFLKTLEEPSGNTLIILETSQPDALLPTVLSRCHIIRLPDRVPPCQPEYLTTLTQLTSASTGEKLKMIDTIAKTRDEALLFVDQAIAALHKELADHHSHTKLLRALLATRTQILGNITPKLALDAVFLS